MVFPMPIPPKPPWYSTPTAIAPLPTAVPNSCNSLIESPTDTPDNIENNNKNNNDDRPDNDDDDDNNNDVDCFPRQDKQPVPLQDISPTESTTTDTLPSLIESTTDTPTDPMNFENNNNNNNNNNNDPSNDGDDDDNTNGKNDNDIDCFPRNKQLVLPQDTTAPPHEKNPDDDDDSTIIHDNRYYDNSDYDDDDTYGNYSDDADYNYDYDEYKFDYNNPLDADDGDDHDDDDDDDDDSYTYCSSDEDDYYNNNNTPNVIFDMHGHQFTIDENDDNMVPYDDKPMTLQAAQRQINAILAKCTTASSIKEFTDQAKRKHDEFFLPNKNANRTLPATPSPVPTTYARNDHDAYLHHRWNIRNRKNTTTTSPSTTKPTSAAATPTYQKAYAPIEIPVKDDQSITLTLETLSTLDTRSSDPTYNDTDAILNITIWNQPIEYNTECRSGPLPPVIDPANTPVLLYSML